MLTSLILILNLFILESLLSVDNATALAVLVKRLPASDQPKALRYGLLGAFVFRGICLVLAAWLVSVLWLKIVGGLYLIYLTYGHFSATNDTLEEDLSSSNSKILSFFKNKIGVFWSTVIAVELLDLSLSLDNIFAAVSMTNNIILIMVGVFMGIVAMRFIAGWFTKLITKYPTLENSAFIVIGLLGLKLILSGIVDYIPSLFFVKENLESHLFDFGFSGIMMLIFFVPILIKNKKSVKPIIIQFYK